MFPLSKTLLKLIGFKLKSTRFANVIAKKLSVVSRAKSLNQNIYIINHYVRTTSQSWVENINGCLSQGRGTWRHLRLKNTYNPWTFFKKREWLMKMASPGATLNRSVADLCFRIWLCRPVFIYRTQVNQIQLNSSLNENQRSVISWKFKDG